MSEFRRLGAIIGKERDRLWKTSPGLGLQSLWEQAVGPDIAANATVRSLSGGVMTVVCSSGGWACELKLAASDLIGRMNELGPPEKITEIRFVHQAVTSRKSRK